MASFPTSVFAPGTKNSGDTIQAAHVNDLQDEVVAIEGGYINGTAPLNSSNSTMAALSVTGASTIAGHVLSSAGVQLGTGYLRITSEVLSLVGSGSTQQNNVALGNVAMLIINGNSTAVGVSGISGGTHGRVLWVQNYSSALVTFQYEHTGSSARNRILAPGTSNAILGYGEVGTLVYSTTGAAGLTPRWVYMGRGA